MTRIGVLRAGYAALAVAFLAAVGTFAAGNLLFVELLAALVAAILLAASGEDLPKWTGWALLVYFLLTILSFFAATPITIDKGGGFFVNGKPAAFLVNVQSYLLQAFGVTLAGATLAASWERERGARNLAAASLAGFVLFAILSYTLKPSTGADAGVAVQQGGFIQILAALAALAGLASAAWCAARPDEFA